MQWAGKLALSQELRTRAAGLALLDELATSHLASPDDDLQVLAALNNNSTLGDAETDYS